MQMTKLNSLLEAARGSDKKDTSNLTIGCVHHSDVSIKLFLQGETRPRTEAFKSHHQCIYCSGLLLSAQAGLVRGYDHGGSHSYVIIIVVVVIVKVIFWVAVCHACRQRYVSR